MEGKGGRANVSMETTFKQKHVERLSIKRVMTTTAPFSDSIYTPKSAHLKVRFGLFVLKYAEVRSTWTPEGAGHIRGGA